MSSVEQCLLIETLNRWGQLSESDRLAKAAETRELVRTILATLPSQQLLSLIFGSQSKMNSHPLITELRENHPRRRDLLQAIYGDRWRAIESTYVRLPSPEKRLLVNALVGRMRNRYRWFSSRLLHAYAFRPRGFRRWEPGEPGLVNQPSRPEKRQVHPLYRRVEIARRPGNPRVLHVPAPPLKHLQRVLLETCLDPALATMPASTMGCRKNNETKSFGIFAIASAHVGQQFVAHFDIKDFFPSIQLSDIVETLQRLKTPMLSHLDPQQAGWTKVPWTHDAAVLVSRLATRYGRLPQGAPTSPAIANLVFMRLDQAIQAAVGMDVVYTRYVDDLTFSVSKQVASKLAVKTPADLIAVIQPVVQQILQPTTFTLNHRKTRATDLRGGHSVTGLFVGETRVNLPRETRRRLRGLIHRIERDGVVSVAEKRMGAERFAELSGWTSAVLGFSKNEDKLGSGAALIASFIRSLCPQLVIEIPEQTFAVGTKRVIRDYQLHERETAVKDCMFLLPHIWAGEIVCDFDGGHLEVRRSHDDQHVASIRAERNIELLALSCRQFHASLNLWSHLRGWSAGLHTPAGDSCFAEVSQFRRRIQDAIDRFRIRLPKPQKTEKPTSVSDSGLDSKQSDFSLQPNVNRLRESTHQTYLVIDEILQQVPEFPLERFNDFCRDLEIPADDKIALGDWFATFVRYWQIVPQFKQPDLNQPLDRVQRLAEIMRERISGDRSPVYELEKELLSLACRKNSIDALSADDCNQVQLQVLKEATKALESMRQDQRARKGTLVANEQGSDSRNLDSSIRKAIDDLIDLHDRATWKETSERVFTKTATNRLRRGRLELIAPIKASTNEQAWDALADFAKDLFCWTTDSLSYKKEIFSDPVKRGIQRMKAEPGKKQAYLQVYHEAEGGKEALEILFLLRNHSSHGDAPHRKQDLTRIERYAAKLLGKRFGKKSNPKSSLKLTELESNELKLRFVCELCVAIGKMNRDH